MTHVPTALAESRLQTLREHVGQMGHAQTA
jgi:hypothetical protein